MAVLSSAPCHGREDSDPRAKDPVAKRFGLTVQVYDPKDGSDNPGSVFRACDK
jgi:hypothetical protein